MPLWQEPVQGLGRSYAEPALDAAGLDALLCGALKVPPDQELRVGANVDPAPGLCQTCRHLMFRKQAGVPRGCAASQLLRCTTPQCAWADDFLLRHA